MVFSSIQFIFLFLPAALLVYALAPRRAKNLVLLLLSLYFYASGEARHLWLLLALIGLNYAAGLAIDAGRGRVVRRAAATGAIVIDLAALGWFKYAGFIGGALAPLAHHAIWQGIVLPLGISFYVFHNISYVVDVYRGVAPARRNPIDFALYIAMFPQLIAGPIVRYHDLSDALDHRSVDLARFASGLERFVIGLAKKMVVANTLAVTADQAFAANPATLTASDAWLGLICYTLQIYFDFSGYSDMAIGLARMFGFELLENFNYPYVSRSVQEFWRRWHISLSNWFFEYLYVPLGGSRHGALRTARNLAVVFLLCGLWHGANWTFIAWGAMHGAFLAAERLGFGRALARAPAALARLYTLLAVMLAWVMFRADSLGAALGYYAALFTPGRHGTYTHLLISSISAMVLAAALLGATGAFTWLAGDWRARLGQSRGRLGVAVGSDGAVMLATRTVLLLGLMFISFLQLSSNVYDPFIYFRF